MNIGARPFFSHITLPQTVDISALWQA